MRPVRACLLLLLPIFASAAKVGEVPPISPEIGSGQRLTLMGGSQLGDSRLLTPTLQSGAPSLISLTLPPSVIPRVSVAPTPILNAAPAVKTGMDPLAAPEQPSSLPGGTGQLDTASRKSVEITGDLNAPSGQVQEEQVQGSASAMFDGVAKSGLQQDLAPVLAAPAETAPGYSPRPIYEAAKGDSRRDWSIGGRPATYLGGGGFKDILLHPDDPEVLLTLFTQAGSDDALGSRSERNLDLGRHRPLEELGLAPRVLQVGALKIAQGQGVRQVSYYMQERVRGRTLSQASPADLPLVRALFDRLVAARIKLTDRNQMLENIMVGTTRSQPSRRAYVIDAGEALAVPGQGFMDKLARRPDPLREYYDGLLRDLSARLKTGGRS
ncbi:MAG: hypothetical protein NTY77_00280 [Elusimicrobia bacterium]|nr:hypothetical protein [Elusimicrobiota bacterium]